MQIEIKECCGVHGEIVDKGDVVEVDDPTAKMLIAIGKAVRFNPEDEGEPPAEDEGEGEPPAEDEGEGEGEPGGEIQHQDPTPTHRDPQPKKRR